MRHFSHISRMGLTGGLLALLLLTARCSGERGAAAEGPQGRAVAPEAVAYMEQMQRAYNQGAYQAALVYADSAARYAPDVPDIPYYRGLVYTRLNRFDLSEPAYRKALDLDPTYRAAWFKLGNDAFLQGQYHEALRRYRKELEVIRTSDAETKQFFQDVDREALPSILLQIGRTHQLLNQADSARAAYERSLGLDSTNAQAYVWLGELAESQGELDEAIRLAQRALELDPHNVDYRYLLGSLLNRTGQAEEAVPLLTQVVQRRPWHEGATYNLGQALLRTGQREQGQFFLGRVDTLQALEAEVAEAQAAAYQQPENRHRWLELADLLLGSGRLDEAMNALSVAQYLAPDDLAVQNDMANLVLAMGDTTQALQRFQAIVQQDPTFADGWFNLGVVYAMAGDFEAARAAWNRTLEQAPEHPEARAYLQRLDASPPR